MTHWRREWMPRLALLLAGSGLLLFRLGHLSFSVDEFYNVETDRHALIDIQAVVIGGSDLHPPLTHWISHLWLRAFGESEWALRSIWALAGVLSLALVCRLGMMVEYRPAELLAVALLATSPTFVLYTRFVKYYSFVMVMALATFLVFLKLWYWPNMALWLLYVALLTTFLYGDYFGPALCVLWQNLFCLVWAVRSRERAKWHALLRVLLAQGVAFLLWVPWLGFAFAQVRQAARMGNADLGEGVLALALRVGYGLYSFAVGETLLPWRVTAMVGLLGAAGALAAALVLMIRRPRSPAAWFGSFCVLSMLVLGVLMSSLITHVPFVAFGNHAIFVLPFFALWLSAGIAWLRWPALRWLLFGAMLISHAAGLYNYFSRNEFHNPIYAVPTREIIATLAEQMAPGDVVLAPRDTGIRFYADRTADWSAPVVDTLDEQDVLRLVGSDRPGRVWLFVFGRDRTRRELPRALQDWLEEGYRLVEQRGYVEQDPVYREAKARLLGRPAYKHKLTLYVYERNE